MSTTEEKSTEPAATSWTLPGTPCWIEIPAVDVRRAKAFYGEAFGWTFRPEHPQYSEDHKAVFKVPDPDLKKLGGSIQAVAEDRRRSPEGTVIYLWVDSIEEAFERIKHAGGSVVVDKTPEGNHGFFGKFADTEGNVHGIYTA